MPTKTETVAEKILHALTRDFQNQMDKVYDYQLKVYRGMFEKLRSEIIGSDNCERESEALLLLDLMMQNPKWYNQSSFGDVGRLILENLFDETLVRVNLKGFARIRRKLKQADNSIKDEYGERSSDIFLKFRETVGRSEYSRRLSGDRDEGGTEL